MKSWIVLAALLLPLAGEAADDKPSLLIYQSPQEYTHEVRLGVMPYFGRWMLKGPAVSGAALQAFAPQFSEVGLCDGSGGADVLVWLRSQANYNYAAGLFYGTVTAQFHLGSGKYLTTLKAVGVKDGSALSEYADTALRQAFDAAMQDIARQFSENTAMQQAIAEARSKGMTRAPCAMIGVIPNP